MLWTLLFGAALAAQAPAQGGHAYDVRAAPEAIHLVGAAAFSSEDAELAALDEQEDLEGTPGGVRGRLGKPWRGEVPPAPLVLGLFASTGPGLFALGLVSTAGFGPLLLAVGHAYISAPVLGIVGGALLLRAAHRAGLETPKLAVLGVALPVVGLLSTWLGALTVAESSGPLGVGLLVSGALLPVVAGGVVVAGSLQHGRRAHQAELRVGIAPVKQGAQAGLTLRF